MLSINFWPSVSPFMLWVFFPPFSELQADICSLGLGGRHLHHSERMVFIPESPSPAAKTTMALELLVKGCWEL